MEHRPHRSPPASGENGDVRAVRRRAARL